MATAAIIIGILTAIVSAVGIGLNYTSQQETNKLNQDLVKETNQSNVEQANLAYQRSLPINQVQNLVDAGMSKPAALAALSGGGSYTAPVMQTATADAPQVDMSSMLASMDRLNNIPSNVEQYNLVKEQREALKVDTLNKINQEKRAQELHEFNIWKQGYDKNTALALDSASSKIANKLIDSGKSIQDFKDFEHMIRELGLSDDKDIRNITFIARQQLEDGVRSKFDSERARQQQENQNEAARDSHTKALDDLKSSKLGRALTGEQISKLEREVDEADQRIQEYYDNTEVREKERAVRSARADFERIMAVFGIAKEEFNNSRWWYRDKDGNIKPTGIALQKQGISDAWKFAGSFFGSDLLQDILQGLVMIGK